jgi:hypothetical protein
MNEFADWINEFESKIGFEYSSFDWTKTLPTHAYDIQCSFVRNGKHYVGRGTEENKDLAIIKSTAEMLERFFLDQLKKADSSNGRSKSLEYAVFQDHVVFGGVLQPPKLQAPTFLSLIHS